MIAVHRTETVFDMIVSVGAVHALQDVDLIVIEGFSTLFGLLGEILITTTRHEVDTSHVIKYLEVEAELRKLS